MHTTDAQLLAAWRQVLTLSKVTRGEAVTLLTSTNTNRQTYHAAEIAAT
jgi:2,5-dihydroxypyridine 5,6-dioxygenase